MVSGELQAEKTHNKIATSTTKTGSWKVVTAASKQGSAIAEFQTARPRSFVSSFQMDRWLSETGCEGQFDAQAQKLREGVEQRRQRLESQIADLKSFEIPERLVEAAYPVELSESVEQLVASRVTDKGQ